MQNTSPMLSIIIVSFNTCEITKNCIASIYNANWKDSFEIIVIDNNSQDESVNMIRDKFPDIKLIVNPDNKLFATANNQGAAIAKGKYLLLLNSDTIVDNSNLQNMIDYFENQQDDVICIGPKILNKDGSLQSCGKPQWGNIFQHFVSTFGLNKLIPLHFICAPLYAKASKSHRSGWVSGCCMMIPRNKYIKVGGLNENLIFYGEEPEFEYRTRKLGYKTLYFAGADIIHLGGSSSKTKGAKKRSFEKEISEYESLVRETIGYKKAIVITKITLNALRIKRLFYSNKTFIDSRIKHETKVIEYFKNKLL